VDAEEKIMGSVGGSNIRGGRVNPCLAEDEQRTFNSYLSGDQITYLILNQE
jgi:hypothetical protein